MALEFTNKPDSWTNEGSAPSESLQTNGFTAGYKPPASVFNRMWRKFYLCITEIQTKLSALHTTVSNQQNAKVYVAKASAVPTLKDGEICFILEE